MRARSAIALSVFLIGLIAWIEVVIAVAVLVAAPFDAAGLAFRIVVIAVLFVQARALALRDAGLERVCRERWRVPLIIALVLAFFVIASAAAADPILSIYFIALTLVLTYPIVQVFRGLRTVRGEMQRAADPEFLRRWLLGPILQRGTGSKHVTQPALDRPRLPRAAPWFAVAGGALVLMLGLIVAQEAGAVRFGVGGFMLPCMLLAVFAWRRGQRHLKRSAAEMRQLDPRAPVLILRSFKDDSLRIEGRLSRRPIGLRPTLEEVLTYRLATVGPPISIGEPNEKLPPLGAARDYLRRGDWKTAVEKLVSEAALTIFILGDTENLLWEFATTVRQRGKDALLVVLPPLRDQVDLQRRWQRFAAGNAALLGADFPRRLPDASVIAFFFRADTLVLVESRKRGWWDYELAIRLFVHLHEAALPAAQDMERYVAANAPSLLGLQRLG